MKKILVLLTMSVLLCTFLMGCIASSSELVDKEEMTPYVLVEGNIDATALYVDAETGVTYVWMKGFKSGGITLRVNADGTPYIWPDWYPGWPNEVTDEK